MSKFKVGDVIIVAADKPLGKTKWRVDIITSISGGEYKVGRYSNNYRSLSNSQEGWYTSTIDGHCILFCKKVKATAISRAFYKNQIKEEKDGILTIIT